MTESSAEPRDRARKTVKSVLQALSGTHANTIAVALGVSEACISRLKNEHLDHFALMLAHLGLKVVPVEAKCFSPDYVDSLKTLARAALRDGAGSPVLEWEQ